MNKEELANLMLDVAEEFIKDITKDLEIDKETKEDIQIICNIISEFGSRVVDRIQKNKVTLKEFAKNHINHNTYVTICIEREDYYEHIWKGEAWRIIDDEFLPVHKDVEHCPYRDETEFELIGDDGMVILLKNKEVDTND